MNRGGEPAKIALGLLKLTVPWIVFQDESGVSLTPVVRATWAPKGQTPVLRHKFNWKG